MLFEKNDINVIFKRTELFHFKNHLRTLDSIFFKKMGQSRPLFVYFRSFHIPIQMTNIQFEQYKLKKA